MIKINEEDIQIEEFKILSVGDYFHLTTARTSNYHPSPKDGGINITFNNIVETIPNGHFYITQIVNKHTLEIVTESQKNIKFDSKGEIFKDSNSPSSCHYRYVSIRDNEIQAYDDKEDFSKVVFYDRPYHRLSNQFRRLESILEFETWFQYSTEKDPYINLKPILRFNWSLHGITHKVGGKWQIIRSKSSSQDSIKKSIQYFNVTDKPLLPCELRNISVSVVSYLNDFEEIENAYN